MRMRTLAMAALCLNLVGCGSQPKTDADTKPAAAQPPQQQEQRFDLRGKVVAVDKTQKKLTVDHEAIPGFMGAMTMAYSVKDEHLLDNVAAGDQVSAKLVARGAEYWLEEVRAAGKAAPSK